MAFFSPFSVFAPAKINLYLHVTGKLENGYHTLDSLITFADIGDEIHFEAHEGFEFEIAGPYEAKLNTNDNLIITAAQNLARASNRDLNVKITLTKNLPVSAGIGGGSADAAAAIRGLCKIWNIEESANYLPGLLLNLGADVPVCFSSSPKRILGIGDVLEDPPAFPDLHAVLINPLISCSTAQVFQSLKPDFRAPLQLPENLSSSKNLIDFLADHHNDLQPAALKIVPEISDCLTALQEQNATLSRLSGSGATCFGIFHTEDEAKKAAKAIAAKHPDYWVKPTILRGNQTRHH